MSAHVIYYNKDGAKMMRPVLSREEYLQLRDSAKQRALLKAVREGNEAKKRQLAQMNYSCMPNDDGTLKGAQMMSDTVGMDIDHIAPEQMPAVKERILGKKDELGLLMMEESARGEGYHLVFKRRPEMTQVENLQWASDLLGVKFDEGAKDITRVFFTTTAAELLYLEDGLFRPSKSPLKGDFPTTTTEKDLPDSKIESSPSKGDGRGSSWLPLRSKYADYTYHGHKMVDIIDRYIAVNGEPEVGERHNFYNKMVADFRNICGNSPDVLLDLLPRYDGDDVAAYAGYASQCQSICRKNNNARLPREFYFFLVKNGFYQKNVNANVNLVDDEDDDDEASPFKGDGRGSMPPAPPVIRELISIAPEDFVIPAINSLLPILGTLTSYVRTEDKSNAKTLSTSFFSIIYAPPSSGKSFVERYINLLLRDLFKRDEINDAKDAIYARAQQKKSANDRSEAVPQTSIRIMEAKNSEAEFLEKQRNNKGHHMFTYCSEIDQWRKGIRAAGGNKDDMVRIAWDNGKYGQNFKSSNTFKGKVALYWNVLIAGTSDQLMAYFKNVTNGLVTRCSFAEIENQQFQSKIPQWGKLSQKDMKVIDAFIEKCDEKTYQEPLNYNPEDCYSVSDEDYDKEVPWHFSFKPFEQVSIDWIMKTVEKFNDAQCNRARIDSDEARDTFRRRVAERGKRLALLCTQLYQKTMTKQDKELCKKWIAWWMEQDIENILKPFGRKYIEAMQESTTSSYRGKTILERLGEEFSAGEVRRVADILGYNTPTTKIISRWVTAGVVEKFAQDRWRKVTNGAKGAKGANAVAHVHI